jgi:hypothetical protein
MLATYCRERGSTGNRSIGVFQILSAGKTGQPPTVGLAANEGAAGAIENISPVKATFKPP